MCDDKRDVEARLGAAPKKIEKLILLKCNWHLTDSTYLFLRLYMSVCVCVCVCVCVSVCVCVFCRCEFVFL